MDDSETKMPVPDTAPDTAAAPEPTAKPKPAARPAESGGPAGLEPTRYGDWERAGRCVDF